MVATIERLITAGQAGRRLDRSRERVHQMIRQGKLPAVRTAHGFLIDPEDIERILAERNRATAKQEETPSRAS